MTAKGRPFHVKADTLPIGDSDMVDRIADALYEHTTIGNATVALDERTKIIAIEFDVPARTVDQAMMIAHQVLRSCDEAGADEVASVHVERELALA